MQLVAGLHASERVYCTLWVQDLVFIVRQIPDNRFQREGDDLITHVRIKLPDALAETKIDVPHIDGRILRMPLKEASRAFPFSVSAAETCLRIEYSNPHLLSLEAQTAIVVAL